MRTRRRPRNKNAEHSAIMAAALARDEDAAAALLRDYIRSTAEAMAEALQTSPDAAGAHARDAA